MEINLVEFGKWLGLPALGAGLTFGALRLFGTSWLKSLFDKDLEKFKSEQTRKVEEYKAEQLAKIEAFKATQNETLENLRFDISASLDRTRKLHEFEFQVLPEAWRLLHIAGGSVSAVTARIQTRADVHAMSAADFAAFLDVSPYEFTTMDKEALRQLVGQERQTKYADAVSVYELQTAFKDRGKLHNYLLSHGIFIQAGIRDRLKEVSNLMAAAVQEGKYDREELLQPGEGRWRERQAFNESWSPMITALEQQVQGRLWDARLPTIDQRALGALDQE